MGSKTKLLLLYCQYTLLILHTEPLIRPFKIPQASHVYCQTSVPIEHAHQRLSPPVMLYTPGYSDMAAFTFCLQPLKTFFFLEAVICKTREALDRRINYSGTARPSTCCTNV